VSLRQRKKEQTRDAIVEAAESLFVGRGYGATTMEEVADSADVSVGTLYNYFSSKQQLLIGVFQSETEAMLGAGQAIIDIAPESPKEGVTALLNVYADHLFGIPRELIKEILAFGFGTGEVTDELVSMDVRLMRQFADFLEIYSARGSIRRDVVVSDAVVIAYSVLFANLLMYTSMPGFDLETARTQIVRQVDVVFSGLEPPTN